MNNRAEKAPQQIHRNTEKTSPLRVPPSASTSFSPGINPFNILR